MRRLAPLVALALSCTPGPPDFGYPLDDVLRLNHLQMKGTHNSYHLEPESPLADEWRYSHATITDQLEKQGVRGFELDVHWNEQAEAFSVHHLTGIDEKTTCAWFHDCLLELRRWSDAHPGHHPLVVLVEPKDDVDAAPNLIRGHLDDLDAALLSVWPRERLLVPDDVKGTHANVAAGLKASGWPSLGALRGRAVFVFHDSEREPGRHHYEYTHGLKDLDGRAMFVTSEPGDPYAATVVEDDPGSDKVRLAAAAGFLVRTTGTDGFDASGERTRTRQDAALAGDAHVLTTDYPVEGMTPGYWMDLGGTPSRCHRLAPAGCTAEAVEAPDRLAPR
jgi:hypothetical protein